MSNCFWGHSYGKWEVTGTGEVYRLEKGEKVKVGENMKQKRTCGVCGFTEINAQKIYTV